jgi:hypothetical protein
MHWYVKQKDGHRAEVDPLEYLKSPAGSRNKIQAAVDQVRGDKDIKLAELQETARVGLRLVPKERN